MASFTDDEIKELSKEILEQPQVVQGWQDTYDGSLVKEQEILELDERNKKFFDDYLSYVSAYHNELNALTGEIRTLYNENDLINSSENIGNDVPHYPNPPSYSTYWSNVKPYVTNSVLGNPTSLDYSSQNDKGYIEGILFYKDVITNGFNNGSSDSVDSADVYDTRYEGDYNNIDVNDYNTNDIIILSSGGNYCLVKVRSIDEGALNDPPTTPSDPQFIYWTRILGVEPSSLSGTVDFVNNSVGFTELERVGIDVPLNQPLLDSYKLRIDNTIVDYKNYLNTLKTNLQSLELPAPYKGQNEDEIENIDQLLSDLSLWESKPSTVSNINDDCRFNDFYLNFLQNLVEQRDLNDRQSQVINALGSINQQSDGSYTGNGLYFNLFLWIDKRINLIDGSLAEYKGFPASQKYYLDQLAFAQNILNNYELAYLVIQFSENYEYNEENPSSIIVLSSVDGLNVGDQVKIMDNDSQIFDREIVFINTATNGVTLDSPINTDLNALGKQARLFKEK